MTVAGGLQLRSDKSRFPPERQAAWRGEPAPEDQDFYLLVLNVLWDAFGADRLMYVSNWPVCDTHSDHDTVQSLTRGFFASKGEEALEKFWWKNAKAAYKYVER